MLSLDVSVCPKHGHYNTILVSCSMLVQKCIQAHEEDKSSVYDAKLTFGLGGSLSTSKDTIRP